MDYILLKYINIYSICTISASETQLYIQRTKTFITIYPCDIEMKFVPGLFTYRMQDLKVENTMYTKFCKADIKQKQIRFSCLF